MSPTDLTTSQRLQRSSVEARLTARVLRYLNSWRTLALTESAYQRALTRRRLSVRRQVRYILARQQDSYDWYARLLTAQEDSLCEALLAAETPDARKELLEQLVGDRQHDAAAEAVPE